MLKVFMFRLSSIVAILLLLTAAAPVMACISGATMSHEQSACCHEMHGQCGEMAKTGCCTTQAQNDDTPQIASTSPVVAIHWVVVALLPPSLLPIQVIPQGVSRIPAEYLPPGLLTAKSSVLRI